MAEQNIAIVVQVPEQGARKGLFSDSEIEVREFAVDQLRKTLETEISKLLTVLEGVPKSENWKLNQVEVGLEITAEGGVSFIGTAKVGANTSIKLTFSR